MAKKKAVMEEEFSVKPVVDAVGGTAKKLANAVFPSNAEKVRRAKKRLEALQLQIELKKLERDCVKKLKELEEEGVIE